MFHNGVYVRGAGALQALRELIGDEDFFEIRRIWGQLGPTSRSRRTT